MLDLKPYFDAVNSAQAEVQRIANEIDTRFRDGTDEAKLQALSLKPALDEAQKKADEATALYEAMQKTNRPNDIAKNFVPVSTTAPDPADVSQPTTIKRQAYDAMGLPTRAKFIRSGGTVTD
jgi:hypothetical protein